LRRQSSAGHEITVVSVDGTVRMMRRQEATLEHEVGQGSTQKISVIQLIDLCAIHQDVGWA
jgi:hypothetical protein